MTLCLLDTSACPDCGSELFRVTVDSPPLLRHGGYGAVLRCVTDYCTSSDCVWFLVREIGEVRP